MALLDDANLGLAVKIDVSDIAKPYRDDVRDAIQNRYGGVGPKLVAFLANTVSLISTQSTAFLGTAHLQVPPLSFSRDSSLTPSLPNRIHMLRNMQNGQAKHVKLMGFVTSFVRSMRMNWNRSFMKQMKIQMFMVSSFITPSLVSSQSVCSSNTI